MLPVNLPKGNLLRFKDVKIYNRIHSYDPKTLRAFRGDWNKYEPETFKEAMKMRAEDPDFYDEAESMGDNSIITHIRYITKTPRHIRMRMYSLSNPANRYSHTSILSNKKQFS